MESRRQRDLFVLGLQFAAGLMFAQQIGGKAVRDGLFLVHHAPQSLPAMVAGAAAFSVALSLATGRLLRRVAPRRALPWALGISAVLQIGECRLLNVDPEFGSVVIYLHMAGISGVLLSAFWSMLNEEFDPREAKRRFGQIAAGGTVGGLVGGLVAERTVVWSGASTLMLVLAALHLACAFFLAGLMRRESQARSAPAQESPAIAAPGSVQRSSLLRTLAVIVLLGSAGAALLDYVFKVYATDLLGRDSDLLRFFAVFHMGVALASFLMQSFASRWALEKLGLGNTILVLPATLAGGSFLALLAPGALVALAARAAEAAVRGSLFRAGYETCYTPVPTAEKRLAKAFIDVAAERGGDAAGAGIVYVCLLLAGASAPPVILSLAALVGLASLVLCTALDRIYVAALARSLESRAVRLSGPDEMDLTTRSLVMRSPLARTMADIDSGPAEPPRRDIPLRTLGALRSSDPREVNASLIRCDVSDPLVITQVCLLLDREEHAPLAHTLLLRSVDRIVGVLTDLMLDRSIDLRVRRRIPRILAAATGRRSIDALMYGLEDDRFEVRMQCAKALVRTASKTPRPALRRDFIMAAVDRELAIGTILWESHRMQQLDPAESGAEWLDELLRDKAHGSLEYVFTLLSLIHDHVPLMTAFRSLHVQDPHLRGTALEYLEGILPAKTRELLWDILQERPSAGRQKGEIMQDLMRSSETVVLQLRKRDTGIPRD